MVSKIIFPVKLRLLRRISSGEDGKGTEMLGKKIKIFKNGGGEEYQVGWNLIHPCLSDIHCGSGDGVG